MLQSQLHTFDKFTSFSCHTVFYTWLFVLLHAEEVTRPNAIYVLGATYCKVMDHTYARKPRPFSPSLESASGLTGRNIQYGKCIICSGNRSEKLTAVTLGLRKTRDSALLRNDTALINYLDLNLHTTQFIHETCRSRFSTTDKRLEKSEQTRQLEISNVRGAARSLTRGFDNHIDLNLHTTEYIHKTHWRQFNRTGKLQAEREQTRQSETGNVRRTTRSLTGGFDSNTMCILCRQQVDSTNKKKSSRRKVETLTIAETWDKTCDKHNDDWVNEVRGRIQFCNNDLVAAGAINHKLCNTGFNNCQTKHAGTVKTGRPIKEVANKAFKLVCEQLEKSCKSGVYTVTQLHEMMIGFIKNMTAEVKDEIVEYTQDIDCADPVDADKYELKETQIDNFVQNGVDLFETCNIADDNDSDESESDDDQSAAEFNAYTEQYLLSRLKRKYGKNLFITNLHGQGNVVCLRNSVSGIIYGTWKRQQCQPAERLVSNAAQLIAAQIRKTKCELPTYSSVIDDLLDSYFCVVPSLLRIFMECLIDDEIKRVEISQALMQSVLQNQGDVQTNASL